MGDVRMDATAGQAESHLPLSWLGVLALLTAVAPLSIDMYLPAFPAMAAEFGTAASSGSGVTAAK